MSINEKGSKKVDAGTSLFLLALLSGFFTMWCPAIFPGHGEIMFGASIVFGVSGIVSMLTCQ